VDGGRAFRRNPIKPGSFPDSRAEPFIQWTKQQEPETPVPANPKTIKTKQQRDRLTRMEAMLSELTLLKNVITEVRSFSGL
jgi:hypothetical protein